MRLDPTPDPRHRELRARFESLGYAEDTVARLLGVADLPSLRLDHYPVYERRLRPGVPLHDLVRLALLQQSLPKATLRTLFGEDLAAFLRHAEILVEAGEEGRLEVSFYPCLGQVFATDHRFCAPLRTSVATSPHDPVMYLGPDSYLLARFLIQEKGRRALDVCTGSGVQAVLAAEFSDEVVATDVNPRALDFATFNARTAGVSDRITFLHADLFGNVEGPFDTITVNPPFVPNPEPSLLFRDGGEAILSRILGGLPGLLSRNGRAQVVTTVLVERDRLVARKLRSFLGRADVNGLVLHVGEDDALEYAASHVRRPFGQDYAAFAAETARWLESLEQQSIQAVRGVLITLSPNRHPNGEPWLVEQPARQPVGPAGKALASYFSCLERTRPLLFVDEVRDRTPKPLGRVRISAQTTVAAPDEPERTLLSSDAPTTREALAISHEVAALVARVDGRRTVAEIAGIVAEETGQSLDEASSSTFAVLVELAERGFLVI